MFYYFYGFLKKKKIRRAFIFQSIRMKFCTNIGWIMPNKGTIIDFFILITVFEKKIKKIPKKTLELEFWGFFKQ